MNLWAWSFLVPFAGIFTQTELLELPVFAPNDYFWDKYWDGKDPMTKWEVFAEAVREAMADVGGLILSDSVAEDKMEYKRLVWGKADKED